MKLVLKKDSKRFYLIYMHSASNFQTCPDNNCSIIWCCIVNLSILKVYILILGSRKDRKIFLQINNYHQEQCIKIAQKIIT